MSSRVLNLPEPPPSAISHGFVAWPGGAVPVRLATLPLPPETPLPPLPAVNPCFAAGTRLLTVQGETPVEDLRIGDHLVLADGEIAPAVWIGRRDVDFTAHPAPDLIRPVRIAAGALAMGVPERELALSPDHGLEFDEILVQARDIVDGVVIVQDHDCPGIRYYHVELPRHGILLAEGAGVESLNTGHRDIFGAAPPGPRPDPARPGRETPSISPLVTSGAALAAVRARLHGRKLMLGYGVREEPAVALRIGAEFLGPVETQPGRAIFAIPAGVTAAVLCCPVFVPAEVDPASNDRRVLGLALREIMLDGRFTPLETVVEPRDMHRPAPRETATWTRGAARLRFPVGTVTLTLLIAASPRLWRRAGA